MLLRLGEEPEEELLVFRPRGSQEATGRFVPYGLCHTCILS